MTSLQAAETAKAKIRKLLDGTPGINGIGIAWDADGEPCVRVNVREDVARIDRQRIPTRIGGVGVQVETIGEVHLQSRRRVR
jgi:hypothetical protein